MMAPNVLACVLGLVSMLLLVGAAFVLVESIALSVKTARLVAASALFAMGVLISWSCAHATYLMKPEFEPIAPRAIDLLASGSPASSIVLLLVEAALLAVTMRMLWQTRQGSITPDSVKEAVDALPDGVCFSAEDGTPLLVNAQMDALAHGAFGTAVLDEAALWERLSAGDCLPGYAVERTDARGAGEGTLLVGQGGAWQFSRGRLVVDGAPVVETLAVDVSEEYALAAQLEERNRSIAAVNERMRAYGRDLSRLTREEEILLMKVRVHDEVGRALIALRAYERQEPGRRDRDGLLALWHGVAYLLEGAEGEEEATDDWELLAEAAEAIGVQLGLSGELPRERGARKLVVMVVHECLNNAVRHGDAHRVDVTCSSEGDVVELTVANDGAVPAETPVYGGGLSNLRAILERAGGTLTTSWEPRVAVTARFERGGGRCLRLGS